MEKNTHNPKGLIMINGNLNIVNFKGDIKKHWKNFYRKLSMKFLEDSCEVCSIVTNLTVHHHIPLSKAIIINKYNCRTVCRDCHTIIEHVARVKRTNNGGEEITFEEVKFSVKRILRRGYNKCMKIRPIEHEIENFNLVELSDDGNIGKLTPHCKIHRAMNKVSSFDGGSYWRCIQAISLATGKCVDDCRAGCREIC